MATKKTNKSGSVSHTGAVVGGLAVAAAVGGYFLYHNRDEAKKKLKNVKGWMVKAKGEILEKVEKLKDVNEDLYYKVVDGVLSRYQKLSHIDTTELAKVGKELKSHWKSIQSDLSEGGKKAKTALKQVVDAAAHNKAPAKKTAKKAAK